MKKTPSLFLLLTFILIFVSCTAAPAGTSSPPTVTRSAATPTSAAMPCTVFHVPATPEALGAEFRDRGHVSGPANAPVTIIIFSDYQCPVCAVLAANLKQIRLDHPNDVRLVYLNTSLAKYDKDALAFQAAEAADLQGKFWEMNDLLFEKLAEWFTLAPGEFEAWAAQQAAGLGMDANRFQVDFQGSVVAGRLQQTVQSAENQSVTPPMLFINSSTPYAGMADFASLDAVVRIEILVARQFSACPPWAIDPLKQYFATLHTAKGDVVIQLYADQVPLAVNSFVFLAREGWYDGMTFYKVLPNILAMTGDPSDTGMGNPGYLFDTEMPADLHFDRPGMVAMENNGLNTNGSRFFITLAPDPSLDGQNTIFGQVLSGLDVLNSLTARDPQPGIYYPPGDELIRVTIEER